MNDSDYMSIALKLARKGCKKVSPNPMAGAVIVREGRIIGQGSHLYFGGPHAERNALASLTESPRGATLYVTLEPCCHHGKTPPCTDAIIESGIRRVVIGTRDPNPMVSGKGTKILITNGIEVTEGILEEECRELNHVFFHYIKTGRPLVIMKYAMTLDGKTATFAGHSRWITGERARRRVHEDRSRYSAVMCGVGTILADDSLLTCRLPDTRNPVRIIWIRSFAHRRIPRLLPPAPRPGPYWPPAVLTEKHGFPMKKKAVKSSSFRPVRDAWI